jgi:hypothetical protein
LLLDLALEIELELVLEIDSAPVLPVELLG